MLKIESYGLNLEAPTFEEMQSLVSLIRANADLFPAREESGADEDNEDNEERGASLAIIRGANEKKYCRVANKTRAKVPKHYTGTREEFFAAKLKAMGETEGNPDEETESESDTPPVPAEEQGTVSPDDF